MTTRFELPTEFVKGFHNGNVEVDIPGFSHDSLQPAESVEMKFILSTAEKQSDFGTNSQQMQPSDCFARSGLGVGIDRSEDFCQNAAESCQMRKPYFQKNTLADSSTEHYVSCDISMQH